MRVYLDHNATTPLAPEAAAAMQPWLASGTVANPSSVHAEGRAARDAVESAREQIATAVGAPSPKEIVLTSGATEANHAALAVALGHHLVTTTVEHPSVLDAARASGASLVAVDAHGYVSRAALDAAIQPETRLVSVLWANNEVGVIQDIAEIAALCRARGVLLHVDAVQALGKLPVDVSALGCDLATFSAHKVHGPPGVGALWVRRGVPLEPWLRGGHQERGRRPGTENVAAIAGFGAACARVPELLERAPTIAALRDSLWRGLTALGPAVRHGGDRALPNTLNARFVGVDGELLLMALDLAGVSVSAGSACTAGSLEPSHVLLAMGVPEADARGAVRFSLGERTSPADIDHTLSVVGDALRRAA